MCWYVAGMGQLGVTQEDFILGRERNTAGGLGGTALQMLKGIYIIRQLLLPFLIIHNTLNAFSHLICFECELSSHSPNAH